MPKLPANYVKAPSFDSPTRATGAPPPIVKPKRILELDVATWNALQEASEREGLAAEELVKLALEKYFAPELQPQPATVVMPEPPLVVVEQPRPSLRAQLFDQLHQQFVRRNWGQCLWTLRAIVRS
jgi:hypothetical protein